MLLQMRQVLERKHFEVAVVAAITIPLEKRYGIVVNADLYILESFVKVRAIQIFELVELCLTGAVQGGRKRDPDHSALHEGFQLGRRFLVVLEQFRSKLLGFRVPSFRGKLALFRLEHFIHAHFVHKVLCRGTNSKDGIKA